MLTRKHISIIKAFAIVSLGAYLAANAPAWYASVRYSLAHEDVVAEAIAAETVPPTRLPLAAQAPIRSVPTTSTAAITIQKIGVSAPIVFGIKKDDFKALYGNLSKGVVNYGVRPGEAGGAYIFGHSSDYAWKLNTYAHVFTLLSKLAVGDIVTVTYDDGTSFTFVVSRSFIFDPKKDDPAVLTAMEHTTTPTLLLVTCSPVNSAAKRFIVQAVLVN